MLSIKRLLLISRPISYPLQIAIFAAGLATSHHKSWSWAVFLTILYFTLPGSLVIYGINDIADRESDAKNKRKGGVDGAILQIDEVKPLAVLIAFIIIGAPICFVIIGHPLTALLLIGLSIISYTYSVRPLRLKSIPGIDSFSNAVGALIVFLTGYWANNRALHDISLPATPLILAILLFTIGVHVLGTVGDYDADKLAQDRTIGIGLGKPAASVLAALCFATCYFLVGHSSLFIHGYIILTSLLALTTVKLYQASFVRLVLIIIGVGFPLAYGLQLIART